MSKKIRGHKGSKFNISVTGRHVDVTDAMKEYAWEKLEKVKKYFPRVIDIHIIMDTEKFRQKVEVNLQGNHFDFHATEVSEDMYSSIDKVMSKVERQLKKYKGKIQDHRVSREVIPAIPYEETMDEDFEPKIIKSENFLPKPMFLDEAALELKSANSDFLVFTNADDERINVVYKRKDGHLGLIET